ncbi:uncharacterized protein HMPREF1541_09027 [Cyphellophora europaea CBS 101466]|uniref:Uncharacterized protein n=1 Tax=Cyphellophora europaea (strain CBS 101466) TaxID=1220924 RepID=W2RLY8_CYPE1|nr:uncharacterized protein HMPREF1541_09027 [Cyphellophora europaea CBS 101466]ETN36749.1 hypothetical protein HMPREF1541_09027 [Cyphellophora europaea CBS 101466]
MPLKHTVRVLNPRYALPPQITSILIVCSPDIAVDTVHLGFIYRGTVETMLELSILAKYCSGLHLRRRDEVEEEYLHNFGHNQSFTVVQWEELALPAPLEWDEAGMDNSSTFNIFQPTSNNNPYCMYKTSHIGCSGKVFEVHTFYRSPEAVVDPVGLMIAMIKIQIDRPRRDEILLCVKLRALLIVDDALLAIPENGLPPVPVKQRLENIIHVSSRIPTLAPQYERLSHLSEAICAIGISETVRIELMSISRAILEIMVQLLEPSIVPQLAMCSRP